MNYCLSKDELKSKICVLTGISKLGRILPLIEMLKTNLKNNKNFIKGGLPA